MYHCYKWFQRVKSAWPGCTPLLLLHGFFTTTTTPVPAPSLRTFLTDTHSWGTVPLRHSSVCLGRCSRTSTLASLPSLPPFRLFSPQYLHFL